VATWFLLTVKQVDTGKELKRVTWQMMRTVVLSTIQEINQSLNEICLPGQVPFCKTFTIIYTHQ
jgi:hypothetical protein